MTKRYVAADISPKHSSIIRADLRKLPFKNGEFELSICLHVVEHIVHAVTAIRELARVSKTSVIMVPMIDGDTFRDPNAKTPTARRIAHGQHNHEWQFGKHDFEMKFLRKAFDQVESIGDVFVCTAKNGFAS